MSSILYARPIWLSAEFYWARRVGAKGAIDTTAE